MDPIAAEPLIDQAHLGDLVTNLGAEATSGLLGRFCERIPAHVDAIGSAAARGDGKADYTEAHKLKGVAANMACARVQRVAEEIQRLSGDTASLGALLSALSAAADETVKALQALQLDDSSSA